MNALHVCQWRGGKREYVTTFLKRLGIGYKKGHGFWINNEAELDYIFAEMCDRSRKLKVALHPQNGGSPESFSDFVAQFDQAKRSFYSHGVRDPGAALAALRAHENKRVTDLSRANFRNRHRN